MQLVSVKPRKVLNKAFLKVKPIRNEIESFKTNLIQLIDRTNDSLAESEEFHKNLVSDFLKKTWYDPHHFINTKGRNDLVIHNGPKPNSTVGVIIEAKKPSNRAEMVSRERLNTKAFQELVLYYLRERITQRNLEVKYLVITNISEWFIFDATVFDRHFAQNKQLVHEFTQFENGALSDTTTNYFYKNIASPAIDAIQGDIEFTWFNLKDYQKTLRNDNKEDDTRLVSLFKLLSPEHLLKLPFTNDSNSLDKRFYSELLHIIGLTETKQGGKKLIERRNKGDRHSGSLLEDTIIQLDSTEKIDRLPQASQYGDTKQDQLFNVALELCITWVNRILFLKLLEAQLITYHKGDTSYGFLSATRIRNYDDLNSLFFQVLARKHDDRNDDVKRLFEKVPYLNSSLFEPTELEHNTLMISNLKDDKAIPVYTDTVLKNEQGKRRGGDMGTLPYLFSFLNAYDFSSEGSEDIQEDNKSLINASVLGLIFEKINGYKDGSFFTPGFITMYMCRETIRRAVVQQFNEAKGWTCETLDDVYDRIEDRNDANEIVNSIRICDPAVGSGHFLVSALNEMIAVKNDLRILQDRDGKRMKEYHLEVVNDELIVTDDDGELYEYSPASRESQRVQESLFHEKQTIIENCLFGVDINPNSVKICRLRLWIELLKNAYYKNATELETLPNIDINIKCGNSLVSRFAIDADLGQALKKSKWNIKSYQRAVDSYRNAQSKAEKREMEKLISLIKSDFRSEIQENDPKVKRLKKLNEELVKHTTQKNLFDMTRAQKTAWNKKADKLGSQIKKLETEIEEIKANKIYENAFEWRFEFPEVLNQKGDFAGFDVVIGNPPYISHDKLDYRNYLKSNYQTFQPFADIYCYFFELGVRVAKRDGAVNYITSNSFLKADYGKPLRDFFNSKGQFVELINLIDVQIFDDAVVNTVIAHFRRDSLENRSLIVNSAFDKNESFRDFVRTNKFYYTFEDFNFQSWNLSPPENINLAKKIKSKGITLEKLGAKIRLGVATGSNEAFIIDEETKKALIHKDVRSQEVIKPVLRGRDISRYAYSQEKFILLTKNGIDVEKQYPAVFDYLSEFGEEFQNRGAQGKHWTNLRACSFFDDFKKPKIIWIELTDINKFAVCEDEFYLLNSAYFLIPPDHVDLYFLAGVLNSKLIRFYLRLIANTSGVGTTRWINAYVKQFPIYRETSYESVIKSTVIEIIEIKIQTPEADTSDLEQQIDQLVYKLYGLTEEEIAIVEGKFG